ncbi:hypothetical protein D3C71_738390 [compost metagenome]
MGLERAGYRHLHRQFTEADHHQVHQESGDQVRQNRAHRTALIDDHTGAHEQPGTDHAAQRQHENVPALQGAGELDAFAIDVFTHVRHLNS